ncbi:MAG: AAA-like domain-containing protein [Thermoflexales bacterium]|nr:AAA-like domain-containing protein [Thermoflexales bacterium]
MTIDMHLVRADPSLQHTPHLMEEAEQGQLDLATYTFLLLKDLAVHPDPLRRALSLVDEGNMALARRFISAYTLDEAEVAELEAHCQQVEVATRALTLSIDRHITRLRPVLGPAELSKCTARREAARAAVQQGRHHIAQRELTTLQYILLDVEKSLSKEQRARLASSTRPATVGTGQLDLVSPHIVGAGLAPAPASGKPQPSGTKPQPELEQPDLLSSAVMAWAEVTAKFSSPIKAWLRPGVEAKHTFSYIGVRQLLQEAQQIDEGWRQRSENALRQYFYMVEDERSQLRDLFCQSLAAYALACLKESISYKDFDTARLIHDDINRLFEANAAWRCSDQFAYDTYRYGIEARAALSAQDLAQPFEAFEQILFEQARKCPSRLGQKQVNKVLNDARVLFFYYRIQQFKHRYQELVQFYTEHYVVVDTLARGDVELNRFLELAKARYNEALYRKAEDELTNLTLPLDLAFRDTLQFIRDLAPYQIVPALKSIGAGLEDTEYEPGALAPMYELVLILLDMQSPEELVFARQRIAELANLMRSATGEAGLVLLNPPDGETMPVDVLQATENWVDHSIAAVSKTDLVSVRQHIAYALEEIRGQRQLLQDCAPALRHLWHTLGDHWISILVGLQRAISRQTALDLTLQSEEIIAGEESALLVYVRNRGPGVARHIEVALIGPDMSIKPGIQRYPLLAPGDESSLSFNVKPRTTAAHFEVRLLVRYLDADDQPILSSENRTLTAKQLGDKGIPRQSPYVWGQPLAKDSEVFFGRQDVFEFLGTRFWGQERNKIVALQGERRMGKTSVLYQLGKRKVFGDYRVVMFDFQGRYANVDNMYEFLFNFARRIRSEARLPAELQVDKADFLVSARSYYDVFEEWLDRAEAELEQRDTQVVILFDEFEKLLSRRFDDSINANPRLVEELLQYLRSVMLTRQRFNWVITGSWSLVARQREYFSSLFGMAISCWISYLTREDAMALIQAPVQDYLTYDQDAVERILRLTGGHPFYIQMICDALFNRARGLNARRILAADVNLVTHDTLQQVTESSFRTNWVSLSSAVARKVLSAVAEAMQEPHDYVLVKNVLNYLHRKSPGLDEDAFYAVLDQDNGELIRRELIEVHPNDPQRLRVRSELLYHWLRKSKSLATVLREER